MKKVLLGVVIALVLVFGGCFAVVAGGLSAVDEEMKKDAQTSADGGVTSNTDDDAIDHITVKTCKVSEFGLITAKLIIDNKGDDQASYIVTAEAVKGERRVAELNAIANDVRPGQKVNTDASGAIDQQVKDVNCQLVSVDRF
jgi:hypothetical protein